MAVVTTEPTLELLYRPVAGGAGLHSFLVYTDKDGKKWGYSGFPEGKWPNFGNLQVEFKLLAPDSFDFDFYADQSGTNTRSYIIAQGETLSAMDTMLLLEITARTINEGEIEYNMVRNATNSNSAVAAALEVLGLSGALSQFPPHGYTPGIDNNLGANTWDLDDLINGSSANNLSSNLDNIADFLQGLNSDLDNMDGLRGLGDVKLNTEASINGGWPNDNELTGSSNDNSSDDNDDDSSSSSSVSSSSSSSSSGSSSSSSSSGSGAGGGGWNADNELTVGDAGGGGGSSYCAANDNNRFEYLRVA